MVLKLLIQNLIRDLIFKKNEKKIKYQTNYSSKCYSLFDETGKNSKKATKGIRSSDELNHDLFLSALYSDSKHYSKQMRMNFSKKYGSMTIIEQRKKALNTTFTKMYVNPDSITITPHKLNGVYI